MLPVSARHHLVVGPSYAPGMPRLSLERRLERFVTGTFAKTFRSGVHPVEIGRRIVREIEGGVQVGIKGSVAPNHFSVLLSPDDFERFSTFQAALAQELADAAREHATEYRYHFVGSVTVELESHSKLGRGTFEVASAIVATQGFGPASLRLHDGERIPIAGMTASIGRMPDCTVQLADPKSSRYHAEVRHDGVGYVVVDLQSTNGTKLNGNAVAESKLSDGDLIQIGESVIRFEAS